MDAPVEAIVDATFNEGRLVNETRFNLAPGSGAMIEFRIPEAGMYGLVDHDKLSYVPFGMVLALDATGGAAHVTH